MKVKGSVDGLKPTAVNILWKKLWSKADLVLIDAHYFLALIALHTPRRTLSNGPHYINQTIKKILMLLWEISAL